MAGRLGNRRVAVVPVQGAAGSQGTGGIGMALCGLSTVLRWLLLGDMGFPAVWLRFLTPGNFVSQGCQFFKQFFKLYEAQTNV
jgi:hypothetical protein